MRKEALNFVKSKEEYMGEFEMKKWIGKGSNYIINLKIKEMIKSLFFFKYALGG